jgi:hypothetical protein
MPFVFLTLALALLHLPRRASCPWGISSLFVPAGAQAAAEVAVAMAEETEEAEVVVGAAVAEEAMGRQWWWGGGGAGWPWHSVTLPSPAARRSSS